MVLQTIKEKTIKEIENENIKLTLTYDRGVLSVGINENVRKILKNFIVENRTEYFYLRNYEYKRYLIKTQLRNSINDYGLLFFSLNILSDTKRISFNIGSIHELEGIKKEINKEFQKIINYYLNYNNLTRGFNDGV